MSDIENSKNGINDHQEILPESAVQPAKLPLFPIFRKLPQGILDINLGIFSLLFTIFGFLSIGKLFFAFLHNDYSDKSLLDMPEYYFAIGALLGLVSIIKLKLFKPKNPRMRNGQPFHSVNDLHMSYIGLAVSLSMFLPIVGSL